MVSEPRKAAVLQGGNHCRNLCVVVRPPPGCASSARTSTPSAELAPEYDVETSLLGEAQGDNALQAWSSLVRLLHLE